MDRDFRGTILRYRRGEQRPCRGAGLRAPASPLLFEELGRGARIKIIRAPEVFFECPRAPEGHTDEIERGSQRFHPFRDRVEDDQGKSFFDQISRHGLPIAPRPIKPT